MGQEENWLEKSLEAYRLAQAELTRVKSMKRQDAAFFVDEIADVLLDLKQATIELDSLRAANARGELKVLLADLRDLLQGETE
jgi:hypothetical protein